MRPQAPPKTGQVTCYSTGQIICSLHVTVFDQLEPAAEGQFFRILDGEDHRYTLQDQGLSYALGLAVIDELRGALRNRRDVHEALKTVLEPIAALDQAADATLAALTIACLDSRIPEQIGVSLLCEFTQLQNPDEALFESFTELARCRVRVFCEASEKVWMEADPAPNEDWLKESLQSVKHHLEVWNGIQPSIEKWLRFWWPDEHIHYKMRHTQAAKHEERQRLEAERDARVNTLGVIEREYLSRLIRQEASPYRLMTLAFELCAGMPLEELADAIACTSFSLALTPSFYAPDKDLTNLVRFDRCDWPMVREKLASHARRLSVDGTSISGRWAAVKLLYATGAAEDSMEAHKLALELNKHRPPGNARRLAETYCATDPCDPSSTRPDNIDTTAKKYELLDLDKLKRFMGSSEEDSFFEKAIPGLSRFSPVVAVQKCREFLTTTPARRGLALRQATLEASNHGVLMDKSLAHQFLTLSMGLPNNPADVDAASVEYVQQALLLAAFPWLSPEEQFSGLAAVSDPGHIWLEVLDVTRPGSPSRLMDAVRRIGPFDIRVVVPLALACRIDGLPLPGFSELLPDLLTSPHSVVRTVALNLVSTSRDPQQLQVVVESDWSSALLHHRASSTRIGSNMVGK